MYCGRYWFHHEWISYHRFVCSRYSLHCISTVMQTFKSNTEHIHVSRTRTLAAATVIEHVAAIIDPDCWMRADYPSLAPSRGEQGCLTHGVAWRTPYFWFLAVLREYWLPWHDPPSSGGFGEKNTKILCLLVSWYPNKMCFCTKKRNFYSVT